MSCHQAGGIAPFSLTDYDSAVENSSRAMHQIEIGAMPPFDAREEADCTPRFGWVDDPRLSKLEKDKLQMWIDDGHALGTVAEIPKPPATDLSNVTKTLTPATPWVTSGTRDQFICYVLDPGATKLEWMTGLQVKPDNELVVHHAVITELLPGTAQQTLLAAHPVGQPWDCSQAQQPGDFTVNVWTPGNQPMQTDGNIAVPVQAGAKFVMQIHYHPAGTTADPDATAIDIRFSNTWPQRMYFVAAFGNEAAAPNLLPGDGDAGTPRFMIPAMAANHEEHMRVTIPNLGTLTDVRLWSANPHMHLIGTHIASTIERPAARGSDPQTECLANGAWNFDWQRTYQYDSPLDKLPSVQAGDIIDIKCKWDNSLNNPFTLRMMHDSGLSAPIDVNLGEQTTNEMCLEIFGLSLPAPAMARTASFEVPHIAAQPVRVR